MKKIWHWLNTPIDCLPAWQTLLIGFLGGIVIGIEIGSMFINIGGIK